jgi:hypothetical protein
MGHALDGLLEEWAGEDYGPDLDGLKRQADEATALLGRTIDHMKEADDRALIDYYASDLSDLAVDVLTSWLVLRDARTGERKKELARVHFAETMPRARGRVATLQALEPAPVQVREIVLAETV